MIKVGQTITIAHTARRYGAPQIMAEATVDKIGKRWVTAGRYKYALHDEEGDAHNLARGLPSADGDSLLYESPEAHARHRELVETWNALRQTISHAYSIPDHLTLNQARNILRVLTKANSLTHPSD